MKFLMDFIMPPLKMSKCMSDVAQSRTDKLYLANLPIECSSRNTQHSCRNYVSKVLTNLNELRRSNRFCDVEIIAEDKIFKAHRAVLAASSPYFQAMFTGGLCEKDQHSVELHGISAYIFEILLNFIYSGEVNITQNNVQELMIASDMVGLSEIVMGCTEFVIKELHHMNAIGIYRFADDHNWMELKTAAVQYIENNFPTVCKEDEVYDLHKDTIIKFLSSENLKIDTEFQVFQAALRWINHDILGRRQYVFDILKNVRLPLLPLGLLERAITQCNDSSLRVALKSIHSDLLNRKGCLVPLNVTPRKSAKKDIYVIGGSKRELRSVWDRGLEMNYVSVEKFNTFNRQWDKVPDMTVNRLVPGVASLNGHIYVVGGEDGSSILSSCERFEPQTNQWTDVASMVVSRCEFGFCALDGYLYAMGGWVDTDISGSIERYDPKIDEWRLVGSLPEPRFSMGLVSYEVVNTSMELCGSQTEIELTKIGPNSTMTVMLTAVDHNSICKMRVIAPSTHVIYMQFVEPKSEAKRTPINASNSHPPCVMSIFLPENPRVPVWKGDPCSENALTEVDLLTPDFKIMWNPPSNSSFTKGRKFILTAVGQGQVCKEPGQHTCMRIGWDPMMCVADSLLCNGFPNCPKSSTTSDEDEKLCKKSFFAPTSLEQLAVELFKKWKPPELSSNKWLHEKLEQHAAATAMPKKSFNSWREWRDITKPEITSTSTTTTTTESSPKRPPKATDSISQVLSKYGPWGYLMLGMLICGTVLMFCGLWECCFRRPKTQMDETLSPNQPTTVLVINPREEAAPSPPNYDELDQPPSYSILFPNFKVIQIPSDSGNSTNTCEAENSCDRVQAETNSSDGTRREET